jgi:hypothetical protein
MRLFPKLSLGELVGSLIQGIDTLMGAVWQDIRTGWEAAWDLGARSQAIRAGLETIAGSVRTGSALERLTTDEKARLRKEEADLNAEIAEDMARARKESGLTNRAARESQARTRRAGRRAKAARAITRRVEATGEATRVVRDAVAAHVSEIDAARDRFRAIARRQDP